MMKLVLPLANKANHNSGPARGLLEVIRPRFGAAAFFATVRPPTLRYVRPSWTSPRLSPLSLN